MKMGGVEDTPNTANGGMKMVGLEATLRILNGGLKKTQTRGSPLLERKFLQNVKVEWEYMNKGKTQQQA